MVPRYILQLLFSEKITKLTITQQPLKVEKNSTDLEFSESKKNFDIPFTKFKTINFYLIKLATEFLLTTKLFTGVKSLIIQH
jgi:hypothetical protein